MLKESHNNNNADSESMQEASLDLDRERVGLRGPDAYNAQVGRNVPSYLAGERRAAPLGSGAVVNPFYRPEHLDIQVQCLARGHAASGCIGPRNCPSLSLSAPWPPLSTSACFLFLQLLMRVCVVRKAVWVSRAVLFSPSLTPFIVSLLVP